MELTEETLPVIIGLSKQNGICDEAVEVLESNTVDDLKVHPWAPQGVMWYSQKVLKKRWKECESLIFADPAVSYYYAANVIQGRWKEAEPTFLRYPQWATKYALNVLRRRWVEAEELIKADVYWSQRYKELL